MKVTLPTHDVLKPFTSVTFWSAFFLLIVLYNLSAPHLSTLKQRAWVLTAISSGFMSLSSLPLVFSYSNSHGDLGSVSTSINILWTHTSSRFFQAYLVADLTMGVLHYRSKVNVLTGWVHHVVYVFIVEYTLRMEWNHIFCLCAVMEVPTFALAIASIDARLRSDTFFAISFFLTRIVLHIVLCVSLFVDRNVVTGGSYGPGVIMACIFPLHAFWFSGCIKGFFKRAKGRITVPNPSSGDKMTVKRINPGTTTVTPPGALSRAFTHATRSPFFSRRRSALRLAVRTWWDQLGFWKAGGRLNEMQHQIRTAFTAHERVYEYVGLESPTRSARRMGLTLEDREGDAAL